MLSKKSNQVKYIRLLSKKTGFPQKCFWLLIHFPLPLFLVIFISVCCQDGQWSVIHEQHAFTKSALSQFPTVYFFLVIDVSNLKFRQLYK